MGQDGFQAHDVPRSIPADKRTRIEIAQGCTPHAIYPIGLPLRAQSEMPFRAGRTGCDPFMIRMAKYDAMTNAEAVDYAPATVRQDDDNVATYIFSLVNKKIISQEIFARNRMPHP